MRATKAGNTSKKRHGGLVQTVSSHREREREKAFVKAMKAGNTSKKRDMVGWSKQLAVIERERERERVCEG